MNIDFYSVFYNDIPLAQHMTLETAVILVEAMFQKYWREEDLHYTIKKEPPPVGDGPCKETP